LLFIRNNTLMAQPFNESKLQLSGEAYAVADDIEVEGESGPTGYGAFSVSFDEVLSYRAGASSIVQFELYADDWTIDGRYILYESHDPKTKFDLWVLPMTGERKPFVFLQTEFNETHSQFSPNGRWVAYVSDESGRPEVYVQSFAPSGGKWQISTGGGDHREWRRDGKELFYLSSAKQLMSVPVESGAAFEAGIPAPLFEVFVPAKSMTRDRNDYVVAENGQRFLVCSFVDKERARPITVVSNWRAALKDK
jgi:eukaryotic-like serine/threonine-protein kinase